PRFRGYDRVKWPCGTSAPSHGWHVLGRIVSAEHRLHSARALRSEAVVFLPSLTACAQPLFPSGSIAGAPRRLTIPGPYGPGFISNELHLPLIPAQAGIQNGHLKKT